MPLRLAFALHLLAQARLTHFIRPSINVPFSPLDTVIEFPWDGRLTLYARRSGVAPPWSPPDPCTPGNVHDCGNRPTMPLDTVIEFPWDGRLTLYARRSGVAPPWSPPDPCTPGNVHDWGNRPTTDSTIPRQNPCPGAQSRRLSVIACGC